jgi:hypothetical protein
VVVAYERINNGESGIYANRVTGPRPHDPAVPDCAGEAGPGCLAASGASRSGRTGPWPGLQAKEERGGQPRLNPAEQSRIALLLHTTRLDATPTVIPINRPLGPG